MSATIDIKSHPALIEFKDQARELKRQNPTIGMAQAHEVLARSRGFRTYLAFRQSLTASA